MGGLAAGGWSLVDGGYGRRGMGATGYGRAGWRHGWTWRCTASADANPFQQELNAEALKSLRQRFVPAAPAEAAGESKSPTE